MTEVFLADFRPWSLCSAHGGRPARPLAQPEGIGPEEVERPKKEHPFKRWLRMLRFKKDPV